VIKNHNTHNCPECGAETLDPPEGPADYLCQDCRGKVIEARAEKKRDRRKARPWVNLESIA